MNVFWDPYGLDRPHTGIFRYASELQGALHRQSCSVASLPLRAGPKFFWTVQAHLRKPSLPSRAVVHGLCNFNVHRWQESQKNVLTIHDLIPFVAAPHSLQSWQLRCLLPGALKAADQIIAVSKWTYQSLQQYYPEEMHKVQIIPNGVRPLRHFAPQVSGPHKLLTVSRWDHYKNLLFCHQIFAAFPADTEFDIVTDARGFDALHRYASPRFRIHQKLSDDQLSALYEKTTAYVQPSYFEGFCLPVAEALSHMKPCFVMQGSAVEEMISAGANGLVLPRGASGGEWASAIQSFQFDQVKFTSAYQSLSTWDQCATRVLDLYRRLAIDDPRSHDC